MNNRLLELDILRGLSVFGMILVINPGNWSHQFHWLQHAEWQGFPISDMIFPTFLFCVGVSMALSYAKLIEKGATYSDLLKKSLLRSLWMILIGLFINAFPHFDWQAMRIAGVIQRIGICYLLVSNLMLAIMFLRPGNKVLLLCASALLILAGYFVLLSFIPVPDPKIPLIGGLNIWPAYVDQQLFGMNHIWPYSKIEGQIAFDPDGLLSSLPACVNVIFGLIVGVIINEHARFYKARHLLIGGVLILTSGLALDYFGLIPIIKKMWTSSFVLYSSGFSVTVMAVVKIILDKVSSGSKLCYPFVVFGSNALLAFVVSYLIMSLMDTGLNDSGTSFRQIGFEYLQYLSADVEWVSFYYSLIPLTVYFIGFQKMYEKKWLVRL